jgi:FKBP-type peptidyl-prolyl cis-trans isomerase
MRLVMISAALYMAEGALLHGPSPARSEPSRQRLPRRDACTAVAAAAAVWLGPAHAHAAEQAVRMEGLNGPGKSKTNYPDYEKTDSGLQIKEFKPGSGPVAKAGDRVTLEWTGVTVGYQGRYFEVRSACACQRPPRVLPALCLRRRRLPTPSCIPTPCRPFQTRNKPKGGAFADDGFLQEPLAFTVGDKTVVPGIDEAVRGMAPGGIRRIIVPEEIGYPKDGFKSVGPKPSTFSGERALDFVLASRDNMMDKTLMFDLKLSTVKAR